MKMILLAAAALLGSAAPAAAAETIGGLFNTGTESSNIALPGGNGVTDPHYVILTSTSPGFDGEQAVTYYNGAYAPNDVNSRWISLTGNGTPVNNVTTYQLTFDLTGFDPLTAILSGSWGADNSAIMLLNGNPTGNTVVGFGSLTPFTITSGFTSGINTLGFRVSDFGVVTALRVDDLTGTAELAGAAAVPEPSTWAMMLLGFGFVGGAMRSAKRRQKATVSYA